MADITDRRGQARPGRRSRVRYEPTFILRGLTEINIKFTPDGEVVEARSSRSPRSQGWSRPLRHAREEQAVGRLRDVAVLRRAQIALVLDAVHFRRAEPARFVSARRPAEHQPSPRRHAECVVGGVVAVGTQHDVRRDARRAVGIVALAGGGGAAAERPPGAAVSSPTVTNAASTATMDRTALFSHERERNSPFRRALLRPTIRLTSYACIGCRSPASRRRQ